MFCIALRSTTPDINKPPHYKNEKESLIFTVILFKLCTNTDLSTMWVEMYDG